MPNPTRRNDFLSVCCLYLFVDAESESHNKGNDGGNDCRGKMNERHKHTDKGGDYELTEDVELLVAPGLVIANFLCHDN